MTKILCFVPAFGQNISATTFLTTHALQQVFASKNISGGISTLSFPDIAELRAMALTIWYDTMKDSTHILFIDADMGFPPEMVIDMLLLDEPIVGAVYRQRCENISWAGSGSGTPTTERKGNFMLVEGIGFGVTLIRRDAIDKMVKAYPELIDSRISMHPAKGTLQAAGANRLIRLFEKLDVPERGLISEDLAFCIRWNRIGGKVWGAIGYPISHVGPYDFKGRYLDTVEQLEKTQEVAAQAPQIAQVAGIVQVNGTNVSELATVVAEPPSQLTEPQQGGYDQIVGGTSKWPPMGRTPEEVLEAATPEERERAERLAERFEEPVKRKRGRPKKVLEVNGPEKRKRGRPRKSSPQAELIE